MNPPIRFRAAFTGLILALSLSSLAALAAPGVQAVPFAKKAARVKR